jgi:hypothetical protein
MRLITMTAGLWMAAATAIVAAPTDVRAQDAASLDRTTTATIYRSLNAVDLNAVLGLRGYTTVAKEDETSFMITTSSGFRFRAVLMACDVEGQPAGCLGLNLRAMWGMEPDDEPVIGPVVSDFNSRFRIGKALIVEDAVYLERYVITDGGVTLDHIGQELVEFLGSADVLQTNMNEALKD